MRQTRRKATQIWVGTFSSAKQFYGFIRERSDYYEKRDEMEGYGQSDFIETQGESGYDHDFCEGIYSDKTLERSSDLSISFVNSWGKEVDHRMKLVGIKTINAGLSLGLYEPESQREDPEVRNPVSVEGDGFIFHYMGVIEFDC